MEPNICPLCQRRVSDWMMASGKTTIIYYDVTSARANEVVHNSCLIDYKVKYGKEYGT